MLYKVIGTTRSPPKELARTWKKIYSLLDNADIKMTLPETLINAFKALGDKYVELEPNAEVCGYDFFGPVYAEKSNADEADKADTDDAEKPSGSSAAGEDDIAIFVIVVVGVVVAVAFVVIVVIVLANVVIVAVVLTALAT